VAALEVKIVQRATVAVPKCIYEEEFPGFSYGFRPKPGQHDALESGSPTGYKVLEGALAIRTRTGLCRHSKRSLFASENSAGKRFGEARDRGGFFGDTGRFRAIETALSRVSRRQSHGKSKAIPNAPGNRICVGLRGGAGRTRTCNQAIMSPQLIIDGRRRAFAPRPGRQELRSRRYGTAWASAVTVASCGPVPSMIAANVRGGMNASDVRRRMCLSTLPSRSAISANVRTRPDATSSILARALAMARRMASRDSCLSVGLASGCRPKGSRNRVKADLSQLILDGAAAAGFMQPNENGERIATGVDGVPGYLLWCAVHEPKTYMAMLCRILPYHVVPELPHKETLTYEETVAQLRERGLPPGVIDHLRKAPKADALWPGENEDPYGMKNVTPEKTKNDT
jgi:hypothetical protein